MQRPLQHPFIATSVPMLQEGDEKPISGYHCEWMPYQKGQAAKAEAAQASEPSGCSITPMRDQLEYLLVSGAAARLAEVPHEAAAIATGIKNVLDALRPTNVKIDAGASALPVVDPGPDSLEREIQAKANNGPRVTPDALKSEIVSEHYFTAADGVLGAYRAGGDVHPVGGTLSQATHLTLGLLTFCVLVLRNGAKVVGVNYGAIDPAQHSAERGRQEALAQAVDKVYELLGFRLRDELAAA